LKEEHCVYLALDGHASLEHTQVNSRFHLMLTHNTNEAFPDKHVYFVPHSSYDLFSWSLKHYLSCKCPFKVQHPVNNTLIFVDFIGKYCIRRQDKVIKTLKYNNQEGSHDVKKKQCIVIVDTRFNIMSLWSVLVTMYNVPKEQYDWIVFIYTSPSAKQQYKEALANYGLGEEDVNTIKVVGCASLECKPFHIELYNAFLKDELFWKDLMDQGFEKCLIIQDDGMLVNGANLEEFMTFDYVGAPWADVADNKYIKDYINVDLVGNGGFSLRDVKKSYEVCVTYKDEKHMLFYHNINEIPEDVYFVKYLKKIGANVASFNIARKFSVEQVFQYRSCGFHKFWMYHPPQETLRLCDSWLV
jgi:hypothetical protein